MNSHVLTPEEECQKLKCPEQCCSIHIFDNHYHTYCCDTNEYNMHHLPLHHGLLIEDLPYPNHPYIRTNEVHLPPNSQNNTHFKPRSGHLSETHALGWNYMGIASGVITLLLLLIVLFIIFYIFRFWRMKFSRPGHYYPGEPNREMVVYRTTSLPQPQSHTYTCARERNDNCIMQVPAREERIHSLPPYCEEKVLISASSEDNVAVDTGAGTSHEITTATEIQQNNQEPPSYNGLEQSKSLLVDITANRT